MNKRIGIGVLIVCSVFSIFFTGTILSYRLDKLYTLENKQPYQVEYVLNGKTEKAPTENVLNERNLNIELNKEETQSDTEKKIITEEDQFERDKINQYNFEYLHLDAALGHCLSWGEPQVMFYLHDFTVELWYRSEKNAPTIGEERIIALFSNLRIDGFDQPHTSIYGRNFILGATSSDSGELYPFIQWRALQNSTLEDTITTDINIADGYWHHIAVQRDKNAEAIRLFIDFTLIIEKYMPNHIDIETQDQSTVIGGCYNRNYREADIAHVRIWQYVIPIKLFSEPLDNIPIGVKEFLIGDYKFSNTLNYNHGFIHDFSGNKNNLYWIGAPDEMKFEILNKDDTPKKLSNVIYNQNTKEKLVVQQQIYSNFAIFSAVMSGESTGQDMNNNKESYWGAPHYFISIMSDCIRLSLPCIMFYDENIMPESMALAYNHTNFNLIKIPIGSYKGDDTVPKILKQAVGKRFFYFRDYLESHPEIDFVVQIDARDGRINRNPLNYIIDNIAFCDYYLQSIYGFHDYCGGIQGGTSTSILYLYQSMIDIMMQKSFRGNDQNAMYDVLSALKQTKLCIDYPFVHPQKVRTFSKSTYLEHGNWINLRKNGIWGEIPM